MRIQKILGAVTAAAIAFGTIAAGTLAADAATMAKMTKPTHHVLVCKTGFVVHKVKVNGKWVLRCHKPHKPHAKHVMMKHPLLDMMKKSMKPAKKG